MIPAEKLNELESTLLIDDGLLIDTETGEVSVDNDTAQDLSRLGRILRSLIRRQAEVGEFKRHEIERVRAICDHRLDSISVSIVHLTGLAQSHLGQSGKGRAELPGIGVFRSRKLPDTVDTEGYDGMPDNDKQGIQENWPELFRTKIEPDKKAIKENLRVDSQPHCFTLRLGSHKFEFKAE